MAASRADRITRFIESSDVSTHSRPPEEPRARAASRRMAAGPGACGYPSRLAEDGEHLRMTAECLVRKRSVFLYPSPTPNNATNCFSPLRVKLTMRLPGTRAAHF